MGAQPAKVTPISRSGGTASNGDVVASRPNGPMVRPPSTTTGTAHGSRNPNPLPAAAITRATLANRRRLKSLDRSLKTFLRLSNLPGLEYRLRMAGYYTVVDLLDASEDTLKARGFTPLMARRLMTALYDYITRHVEVGPHVRFKMVRQGQKIRQEASEKVKAMPTYGKRNFKRQSSLQDNAGSAKGSRPSILPAAKTPARVRLMSDEVLNLQHLIQPSSSAEGSHQSSSWQLGQVEGSQTQGSTVGTWIEEESRNVVLNDGGGEGGEGRGGGGEIDFLDQVFRESFSPSSADDILVSPSSVSLLSASSWITYLRRSASIPADFRWTGDQMDIYNEEWFLHHHVRHYSCPPSLRSPEPHTPSDVESIFEELRGVGDANAIFGALKQLVQDFRDCLKDGDVGRMGGKEAVEVVLGVMERFCYCPEIIEENLRVIKYLTRGAAPERGCLPPQTMSAVMEAMGYNPASERVQLQGVLAMGSIGRTDPDQCIAVLFDGGLLTLASAMESFETSYSLQIAAMSTLAVALAHVTSGRLKLLTEDGHILDLVLSAVEGYPREPRVQQYGCAFLALLICEVSEQVESGVMQLMVERAMVAMANHAHVHHVTLWASKVFAHAANNAALGDWKLVARCCELLIEALESYPESSDVQKWAAYALYQMATYHRSGSYICEVLVRSSLPAHCSKPHGGLGSEAQTYLKYLANLLERADNDGDQTQRLPWRMQ